MPNYVDTLNIISTGMWNAKSHSIFSKQDIIYERIDRVGYWKYCLANWFLARKVGALLLICIILWVVWLPFILYVIVCVVGIVVIILFSICWVYSTTIVYTIVPIVPLLFTKNAIICKTSQILLNKRNIAKKKYILGTSQNSMKYQENL
jgi:hypothetical protein